MLPIEGLQGLFCEGKLKIIGCCSKERIVQEPPPKKAQGLLSPKTLIKTIFFAIFAMSSCLQWVPPIPSKEENHAPRLVLEQVGIDPLEVVRTIRKSAQNSLFFKIMKVEDSDLEDKLYVYWFLDYDKFPHGAMRCDTLPHEPEKNPAQRVAIRNVDFECEIQPNDSSLEAGSFSVLEVFVMDRPRKTGSTRREWDSAAKWDHWSWVIRVEP